MNYRPSDMSCQGWLQATYSGKLFWPRKQDFSSEQKFIFCASERGLRGLNRPQVLAYRQI
ncbi:hypothetical protein STH12_03406 [Shewanella khirikhana]|uniref:Uncharacterized protein n=1 Tax=Shewanella khirikhana TaxID=1965282 RepID=A0ABM7DRY6_9GAMM|nr:hypothetical protein STH12_03406 [Shewanella khirikhana]